MTDITGRVAFITGAASVLAILLLNHLPRAAQK